MTARTHDLAAVTALAAIVLAQPAFNLTLGTAVLALLANLVGGVAPDIDQPTAPFWRNLPIGGVVGRVIDRMLGGHRFLTHSLAGVALFGWLAWWLLRFVHPILPSVNIGLVWWAFLIGMISHLVMDSFTREGVPWLLPIPVKFGFPPLKSLRLTTGKGLETWVVFPGLATIDVWYLLTHQSRILTLLHRHIL